MRRSVAGQVCGAAESSRTGRGEQAGIPIRTLSLAGGRIVLSRAIRHWRSTSGAPGVQVWPNRKNRTNRTICANHPFSLIVLLSRRLVPMLACVPEAIFTWRNPNPFSQETQAVAKTKTKTSSKTRNASRPAAKTASRKPKSSARKSAPNSKTQSAGSAEVTIDRRRSTRRDGEKNNATSPTAVAPTRLERRQKVNRRRQIDPTTCERDYTDDEVQFMNALDDYKRSSGRMFPTCSEVLEVVRSLGYVRLSPGEQQAATTHASVVAAIESDAQEGPADRDWQ
jgi:hypothetical protein